MNLNQDEKQEEGLMQSDGIHHLTTRSEDHHDGILNSFSMDQSSSGSIQSCTNHHRHATASDDLHLSLNRKSSTPTKHKSLTIQIDSPIDTAAVVQQQSRQQSASVDLFTSTTTPQSKKMFYCKYLKYKGSYDTTVLLPERYTPDLKHSMEGELVKALGIGSFGIVFKAFDNHNGGREVAIKKIGDVFSKRHRKHLLREIKIMKLLNGHPNSSLRNYGLCFTKCFRWEGFYSPSQIEEVPFEVEDLYIVLEFMKDGNLANFMSNSRILQETISPTITRNIMCQILCGLNYMHNFNIIHRDLKPENLLMDGDRVVLADFGLSKKQQTEKGSSYVCFRYYRPPEVVMQYHQQTTAIDVFSVGCIFFELLCLEHGLFKQKELFRVNGVLDHLHKFCEVLGYPSLKDLKGTEKSVHYFQSKLDPNKYNQQPILHEICSNFHPLQADLLKGMLRWNPESRLTIQQALQHEYFANCIYLQNDTLLEAKQIDENSLEVNDDDETLFSIFKHVFYDEILSFKESLSQ
ncbi:hypothetical protein C9374_011213 [Naegleria lovaniensis]|uniref:Protein kinase domain-containing protein n=1 Tax=Naegleria lovaniensis TaxID=51637 RepID=A0AA88KF02_NAELO|nr:uncharacterized protein C9374_011213 [Naegleria lovaniensis]KAG2374134.1 hypothetical protein C9374_011213 [Naegleria lovaniensis]